MSRVAILIGVTAMVVGSQFSASAMNPRAPYKYVYCSGYLNQTDFMSVFSSVFYSKTDEETLKAPRMGAFLTTTIAFFLVEIGDKTQIATIALGAQFGNVLLVTLGTTLGMMIANVPAVYFGNAIVERVSLKWVRIIAALLFLVIGIWVIWAALPLLHGGG